MAGPCAGQPEYDGEPHGLFATVPDRLNADLIEFIGSFKPMMLGLFGSARGPRAEARGHAAQRPAFAGARAYFLTDGRGRRSNLRGDRQQLRS